MHGGVVSLLISLGVLFICNLGFVVYMLVRTPRLQKPLTCAETLKVSPQFNASLIRHPRLTSQGKWIVVMAVAFGAVAIAISVALGWKIVTAGPTREALPAVAAVGIFDLAPLVFVAILYRTHRLVATGHFAAGLVVAARVGAIKSWGLFYDFLDGSGQVVRGHSLRSFYTVALLRAFYGEDLGGYFGVGSYVPVLYRADDSARNALYVSFPWTI
jgi:hypothetical protein